MTLAEPLAPLAQYAQFIVYKLVPSARPGKTDKFPCDYRTGRVPPKGNGGAHDPGIWTDYATAQASLATNGCDGIGFVFTAADPFFFVDIDGALQPDNSWSQTATDLCAALPGAAVEVSQSGTGLHIIGTAAVGEHGCKNIPLGLELYTELRFVALTGTGAVGSAATDCTQAMARIVPHYFPVTAVAANAPDEWTDEPVEEWEGPTDDDDLIRRALNSADRNAAAAFGADTATFRDLWEGNADNLATRYPPDAGSVNGLGYDGSSADAALAAHLAFWTGKDCERIRRLMYRSALVRDKWELRGDYYLPLTIRNACKISTEVAKNMNRPLAAEVSQETAIDSGMTLREGYENMGVEAQLTYFKGCVYVRGENKVHTPDGSLLDQSRFDATYGGYNFIMDAQGQKVTTGAWEAFTRNRVYDSPKCHDLCFRPEMPPGAIIVDEGWSLLNTYVPINTLSLPGDPARFLTFIEKLLPDARDRQILLTYMASVIQNPGYKFQWWPVLQGAEGNGKTLLLRAVSHAVGHRYTHLVDPQKMAKQGNNFNAWVQGNIFLGVEEIYVAERRDFLEGFKSTVTNDRIPLEGKGTNQTTGDNRLNGMLLTNHEDGVPISTDGRRYAVFYTAQQSVEDIERDGMGGAYFPDMYDWLYGRKAYADLGPNYGLAVINNYLRSYALEAEFDPAQLCVRAPKTTSTDAALVASRGRAEQEIVECVQAAKPGFANGWVSSKAVDDLLERIRCPVPRNKRRKMMQSIGYDYHPHLDDGRVNTTVMPDNARPRLYVKMGHLACNLTSPPEIAKRYSADQGPAHANDAGAVFGKPAN